MMVEPQDIQGIGGGDEKESYEQLREFAIALLNNSPYYHHLGMEVLQVEEGKCQLRLPIKAELKNLFGMLHGGVIASLLDSTCSIAAGSLCGPGEIAVTLDQTVNYISNLKEGTLLAEGTAIYKGRNTAIARAEVRDQQGNLVAYGTATIFILKSQQSNA